jgi:predicted MFS family arabinose efflux permease
MVYPFLGVFAAGMGVSLQAVTLPLTGRSLAGVLGPLLAPVADRYGRKTGMVIGLGLFCFGVGLVALWPTYFTFFLALLLANLGNQIFLPAVQAYLGDRVPFGRRGAVLAFTELSWSISFLAVVPFFGLVITRVGWSAPFTLLGLLGLASMLFIIRIVPNEKHCPQKGGLVWQGLRQVLSSRLAWVALSFNLLISFANETVNLVFGVWMRDAFGLNVAALGLAAAVIGLAELTGEGATLALVDRIGKKRAVTIGILFGTLSALALPLFGQTLPGALFGLFLFYLSFEFTLVSFIPLMTEVLPGARATLMASNLAAASVGRGLGALVGSLLYAYGFGANAGAALLLNALALLALSQVRVHETPVQSV